MKEMENNILQIFWWTNLWHTLTNNSVYLKTANGEFQLLCTLWYEHCAAITISANKDTYFPLILHLLLVNLQTMLTYDVKH